MLTPEQRELRKKHLGASDIPALFGLDPFKTGADVWMSKCFDVAEPEKQSDAIDMGNAFEYPLLQWAARELGVELSVNPDDLFAVCKDHPVFSATLDARYIPKSIRRATEAKTTSHAEEYGDPGTDQVPDRVNVQVQQQCLVHELEGVDVVVLMGRNGLRRELYKVERNEKIIQAIIQRGEDFWDRYVIPKIQPPEDAFGIGSLDIIKRVQRVPQTWAEVSDELIEAWDNARVARLNAEKAEKEALSRILTPLGNAEGVQMKDGRVLCYLATTKKILDQPRLKTEHPEIYESMLKDSTSRTVRIKGA